MATLQLLRLVVVVVAAGAVATAPLAKPTTATTCDVTPTPTEPNGWWIGSTINFGTNGTPPPVVYGGKTFGFTKNNIQPASDGTTPACLLARLQRDCVALINQYRSGEKKFSDGTSAPGIPVPALTFVGGQISTCINEAALGDLVVNVKNGGGCAGAHQAAFSCGGLGGYQGQNSCCGRGAGSWGTWDTTNYNTYDKIWAELQSCVQDMWDEGKGGKTGGHYKNMKSADFAYATCGFGFTSNGRIDMVQNFGGTFTQKPPTPFGPSKSPTKRPTMTPTKRPTSKSPTRVPTRRPSTKSPTKTPTKVPTKRPSNLPTKRPTTRAPTRRPTTKAPTKRPTLGG